MSVTQRGNGWQVYVKHGDHRYRKTFSTKEEASVQEALVRQAFKLGKDLPVGAAVASNYTFSDAADKCYEMHWRGTRSEDKVILNMKQLIKWFGKSRPVGDISTDLIDDFIMFEKNKRSSNGTINRKLATLSKIIRHAHEGGRLNRMPVFHRQREGNTRVRWLTKEEEKACIDLMFSWGATDLVDAFIVSIDTGIRRGEMLRIKASDVSKEGLYVYQTKNDQPRIVPLTARARQALSDRAQRMDGLLFPYNDQWERSTWERLRNHLSMPDVVWHTLRHTTCSRLVQGGMPLTHVKEWMGHKTIITTMRYSHLAPKHLQQGVSLLED